MKVYYIIIPVVAVISVILIYGIISNPPPAKPTIEPIDNTLCNNMCYSISRNWNTDGYNVDFLKQPLVKTTCLDALLDGKTLGYCKNRLGTL